MAVRVKAHMQHDECVRDRAANSMPWAQGSLLLSGAKCESTTLHLPFDVRRGSFLSASIWISHTCLTQQPLFTLSSYFSPNSFSGLCTTALLGTGYMATIQSTSGIPLHYAQAPESMLRQNINHPISYQNKKRDFINTTITQIERKAKNLPNKGSPILLPLRDILPSYLNRGYQTIVSS